MPISYKEYPPTWKAIRARILARAGHCCETCAVPNREFIFRCKADRLKWRHPNGADMGETDADYRGTDVVLTIAHLDRTGPPGPNDGPLDCPDDRLAALCQSCHLYLDRKRHQAKAAETRRRKNGLADLF